MNSLSDWLSSRTGCFESSTLQRTPDEGFRNSSELGNAHAIRLLTYRLAGKILILSGPARRLLAKLHRWSGLALLMFLALTSATGGILACREAIDLQVN